MLKGALLTLLAPVVFTVLVVAMGVIAALALVPIGVAVTRMLWMAMMHGRNSLTSETGGLSTEK